jgi:hypothetical protein
MKFLYIDSDKGKQKKFEVDISSIQVTPVELKVLTNKTLQAEPAYFHYLWQSCDWRIVDENGKIQSGLFHERFYTPWDWNKKPTVEYWLCDTDFKTPQEACIEIVKRGCDPTRFLAQQHFYTQYDGEGCFIQTDDFDEALKFYGYKFEPTKEEIEESDKKMDKTFEQIEKLSEHLVSTGRDKSIFANRRSRPLFAKGFTKEA